MNLATENVVYGISKKMETKFPLLNKLIFSDLYRTLVALCLILAMVWMLNEPNLGGWITLIVFAAWAGIRFIRNGPFYFDSLLALGFAYGLFLSIPKATETSIPMYYVAVSIFWIILVFVWLVYDLTGDYLQKIHWENALIGIAVMAVGLTMLETLRWVQGLFAWRASIAYEAPNIAFRASGTFLHHPNSLAAVLNVIWPLVLLRILREKSLIKKSTGGLFLALIFITLILTNSRGGILTMIAIGGCLLLFGLVRRYPGILNRPIDIWTSIPAREKSFGGLALLFFLSLAGIVFWRAAFTGNQASIFSSRNLIWVYSWDVITKSPWIGNGAGNFVKQYAQAAHLPPGFVAPHAHNLELQILAISGLVGMVFFIAALILILRGFLRLIRKIPKDEQLHVVVLGLVFVAVLVHNQFDYLLEGSAWNMVIYAVLLALFLNFSRPYQPIQSWRRWISIGILLGLALLLPVLQLNRLFRGNDQYQKNLDLMKSGAWYDAYPIICNLATRNPDNQFYRFQCSLLLSLAGYSDGNAELLAEALTVEQAALSANPWWPVNRANYAGLLWNAGRQAEAMQEMRVAAQGIALNAQIFLNAGLMADRLGYQREAEKAYLQAMISYPLWIADGRHFSSPAGLAALSRVHDMVYTIDTWEKFQTEIPERTFTSERQWALWRGVAAAQFDDYSSARGFLLDALAKFPDGISENAYYAYTLSKFGNDLEAQKYAAVARFAADRRQITDGPSNELWFSYYVSGHVLLRIGQPSDAIDPLQTAFEMLNLPISPGRYEWFVYNNQAVIWDLNPVLDSGFVSPDLEHDLRWLAGALQESEELGKSRQILQWLEIQNKPRLGLPETMGTSSMGAEYSSIRQP